MNNSSVNTNCKFAFFLSKAGRSLWITMCLSLVVLGLFSCQEEGIHCRVFPVGEEGYGYCILDGRDTLIVQPYMPAVGRRMPFATERHAKAVGDWVCCRLKSGIPPAISREKVEELGRPAS